MTGESSATAEENRVTTSGEVGRATTWEELQCQLNLMLKLLFSAQGEMLQ